MVHSAPFQAYRTGLGTVGLPGGGPSTTVATHRAPEQAVERVKVALKSLSRWRAAGLVPAFCEA